VQLLPQSRGHRTAAPQAPGCPLPLSSDEGLLPGQAQEPRSSPNSSAWGNQEAPLGAKHPAQYSALGPQTQYQILWLLSIPASENISLSTAPGTAEHFLRLGTHAAMLRVLMGDRAGWVHGAGGPTSISRAAHGSALGWFAAAIPRSKQAAPGMKSKCIISIFLPLPRCLELLVCAFSQ